MRLKGLWHIFVNKPRLRDNARFVSNDTNDQWPTVVVQLRSSTQIDIRAVIGFCGFLFVMDDIQYDVVGLDEDKKLDSSETEDENDASFSVEAAAEFGIKLWA